MIRSNHKGNSLVQMRWIFLIIAIVIGDSTGQVQRSFYAARPYSKILPRFKNNGMDSNGDNQRKMDSRIDSSNDVATTLPSQAGEEDERLLQRISSWPEYRQPFWFKNRIAISQWQDGNAKFSEMLRGSGRSQRPITKFRSPFAGFNNIQSMNTFPTSDNSQKK